MISGLQRETPEHMACTGHLHNNMDHTAREQGQTSVPCVTDNEVLLKIDDVAVGAHLLALNITIESYRNDTAGDRLSGILNEVRILAEKSAQTAKIAKELILGSKEFGNAISDTRSDHLPQKGNSEKLYDEDPCENTFLNEELSFQATLLQNLLEKSKYMANITDDEQNDVNCYYLDHDEKNKYSAHHADRKGLEIAFR